MTTPNLSLREVSGAGSSRLQLLHNEALNQLDAIVHVSVLDRDLTAPPGGPSNGDSYIVGGGATGDWAGHDGELAYYLDQWLYHELQPGWCVWIDDEATTFFWDGAAFQQLGSGTTGTGGVIERNTEGFSFADTDVWTQVLSHVIPANTFTSDEAFRIVMFGKAKCNPGVNPNIQFRVRHGASTVFSDSDFYLNDADEMAVVVEAHIVYTESGFTRLSLQVFVSGAEQPVGAPANAAGQYAAVNAYAPIYGVSAQLATLPQTFAIDWKFDNAGPTVEFQRIFYFVQQLF